MINCQIAKQYISQEIDGEISDEELNHLKEHLQSCDECREYQKEMLEIHNILISLPEVTSEKSIVNELINNRILDVESDRLDKKSNNNKTKWRKMKPWYGLVAAVLLIGLYIPNSNIFNNYNLTQNAQDMAIEEKSFGATEENSDVRNVESVDKNVSEDDINNQMGITMTSEPVKVSDGNNNYYLQIENNQLIVLLNGEKIFESDSFEDGIKVEWRVENEYLFYSFLDSEGNVLKEFKVNLLEN